MSDQSKPMSHRLSVAAPPSRRAVKFITGTTICVSFLSLFGLTFTGTVLILVVATPLLVFFSPILVPAVVTMFLIISGFLFSGGCSIAAIVVFLWMYNYVTGKHPPGADKWEHAREKIVETARDMKERAKEYGQYVQHKAQEAAFAQVS